VVIANHFFWLIAVGLSPTCIAAQEASPDEAINTIPLSRLITEFSRKAGETIAFDPTLLKGLTTTLEQWRTTNASDLSSLLQPFSLCLAPVQNGWVIHRCDTQQNENTSKTTQTESNATTRTHPTVEIEVTGFRQSLIRAREIKRLAMVTQESILSEDITDFPDLNLADSLQRIPGITITREGGEGRQISLRGLGPDFTRVKINGMEAMAMTSSAMDARGSVSRTRAFDFTLFASEIFNRIDVSKSYSVEQDEGGIGGTVMLYTPKPFDFVGDINTFTVKQSYNENSKQLDPSMIGLFSRRNDKLGGLVSAVYSQRHTTEFGTNTTRWRQEKKRYSGEEDSVLQHELAQGVFWFPRGHRYSLWNNNQRRLGVTASLQYAPNDKWQIAFNGIASRLQNSLDEHHIAVKDNDNVTLLAWEQNKNDKEILFAKYTDATWRIETREDENTSTFYQLNMDSQWRSTSALSFYVSLGTSASNYLQPKVNKVNIRKTGVDIVTDFREDRFYGESYSTNMDSASLTGLTVKDLYFQENEMHTSFDNAKASLRYLLSNGDSVSVGAHYKSFENTGMDRARSIYPTLDNNALSKVHLSLFSQHPDKTWIQGNLNAIQTHFGLANLQLAAEDTIESSNFKIKENTYALYAMYDSVGHGLGKPLYTQGGIRYFNTQFTSSGIQKGLPSTVTKTYDDVLFSLNTVLELNSNWLWRASVDENITRPSIQDLAITAEVSQASRNEGDIGQVFLGNPYLKPLKSLNVETGVEWYFEDGGILALSSFFKRINNFVVEDAEAIPFRELGLSASLLQDGDSVDDIFYVSTPQNTDTTTFKGFEITYSRDLAFLPSPFDFLGVNTNFTYAEGKTLYRDVQGTGENQVKTFAGLSKCSYNFTLYYEQPQWSARVSAVYRSPYLLSAQPGNTDQDESGYHATTYIDASASMQLSQSLRVTIEGLNLTDVREELYSDSNDRAYNTTLSGRTFLIGFSLEI